VYPAIGIENDATQHAQACCRLFLPPSVLESQKMDPSLVSSPTQDEVYEGIGEPTIFSSMCATRTCLPARHRTTSVGSLHLPTCPPILPSQTAIVNTPTCVLHLALQDVKVKSYLSVVTDNILDT